MFKKEKDYIIIVGCGRLGSTIAEVLSEERKNIIVIDENSDSFSNLSENFSGFTIEANEAESDTLVSAKIHKADTLLAATENDNVNLMIAQIAKFVYNVPKVIARVSDPKKESAFQDLAIEIISPTKLSAEKFSRLI